MLIVAVAAIGLAAGTTEKLNAPTIVSTANVEDASHLRVYDSALFSVDTATTTSVVTWENNSTMPGTVTWYINAAHATGSRSVILIHQEAVDRDMSVWFTVDTIGVIAQNGNYKGKKEYNHTGRAVRLVVKSDSSTVPLTAGDFGFVFKPWENR